MNRRNFFARTIGAIALALGITSAKASRTQSFASTREDGFVPGHLVWKDDQHSEVKFVAGADPATNKITIFRLPYPASPNNYRISNTGKNPVTVEVAGYSVSIEPNGHLVYTFCR